MIYLYMKKQVGEKADKQEVAQSLAKIIPILTQHIKEVSSLGKNIEIQTTIIIK